MGSKPSNIYAADRPESGGADRKQEREHSGLLERAKREFAEHAKAKGAGGVQSERVRHQARDRSAAKAAEARSSPKSRGRKHR